MRLAYSKASHSVRVADLEAAGLLAEIEVEVPAEKVLRFKRRGAPPLRIPSYAKSLASVRRKDDGEPDRSAADLLFAVTCLRWRPPLTPQEIADLLYEHSEKVAEKNQHAAADYVELTIEEAMRRA